MARAKVQNIQALRGVAILLVVVYHTWTIEQKYGGGPGLLSDWVGVGLSGVDLFFVISGFIMVTVTRGLAPGLLTAADFLYRRAARIYPIYWIYSLLLLPVFLARPDMVNSAQGGQADLLASFLLLPQDLLPLLPVGWTLVHEIYFYLVFALFLVVRGPPLAVGLTIWAALVIVLSGLLGGVGDGPVLRLVLHPLTLEFILGAGVGLLARRGLYPKPWLLLTLGALCWVGFYAVHRVSGGVAEPAEGWLRLALFGLPACLVLYGAVGLEARDRAAAPRWLCALGDWSYSLYLSHILVLSALGRIWALVAPPGLLDNLLALPLLIAAAIAWSAVSFRWIERPLVRITHRHNPFHRPSHRPSHRAP